MLSTKGGDGLGEFASGIAWRRNSCPPHYKTAFAFSILLYPHSHRLSLRFAFPIREKYGLTTFHNSDLTA